MAFVLTPFEAPNGSLGLGWRIALAVGWRRWPFTFGFDFQSAYFDSARSRASIPTRDGMLLGDETRDYTAWFIDSFLRLQPPYWPVRPYFEGIVGAKLLQTKYSLRLDGSSSSTERVSESDWTHTLGVGVGIDLPVLGDNVWLTIGIRRLQGGRASYSRPSQLDSDMVIHYETSTDTTIYAIGIAGRASDDACQ